MKTRYMIITTLFLFTILTITQAFGFESSDLNKTISNNSFEKNLPLNIKVTMTDLCLNPKENTSKEETQFWSTLHIKLLSITPEFQLLDGKLDSITEENIFTLTSCPPKTSMNGTFTSVDGNEHSYYLQYNSVTFGYQIDEIFPPQYHDFIDSPLKQFKAWNSLDIIQFKSDLLIDVIQCKEELDLVIKSSDDSPACVKSETKQKLIERGWAKSFS